MARSFGILSTTLLLLFAHNIEGQNTIFDITKKYGAKPKTDVTQAFLSAWKDACASPTPSTLLIPDGEFLMNAVKIEGPCKAYLEFKLVGTLKAPAKVADMNGADGWLTISRVDGLTMTGGGTFDGQGAEAWLAGKGAPAWSKNGFGRNKNIATTPINIRFSSVTNAMVTDLTSKDSKNFHINVIGAKNFTFDNFRVSTPETSVNTDGIHMGRSEGINIINTDIKCGDDCISIGDGTKQLLVDNVTCGPGHGFSIGSLGKTMGEADVVGITFRKSTLTGTTNGVRIKTWPSSPDSYTCTISDVHFEDITLNNVTNPILIDQQYCPWNTCNKKKPSRVKITGVSIKNLRGTFSSQNAVDLICSQAFPCDNVEVGVIDLKYIGTNNTITSSCANVKPILTGSQNPTVCTTSAQSS